jgi:hypothetical protein
VPHLAACRGARLADAHPRAFLVIIECQTVQPYGSAGAEPPPPRTAAASARLVAAVAVIKRSVVRVLRSGQPARPDRQRRVPRPEKLAWAPKAAPVRNRHGSIVSLWAIV